MVLSRRVRIAGPLALLLLAACLPRPAVNRVADKTVVAVAFVRDAEHHGQVSEVPPLLKKRVMGILTERNLDPRELPFASYRGVFEPVRDTQRRLARLSNGAAPVVLLVETKAVFFSQLNGRYRWVVHARLTAARQDGSVPPLSYAMEQSAFVEFEHQREAEALEVVSAAIAARVGALIDDYLAGEGAPGPTAAAPTEPAGDGLYFVMVDRFANGDRSNDGRIDPADPAAFHGGDLQGIIDNLDGLRELGVGTLWVSPVFRMRTEKFFGHGAFHGYWIEDLNEIEPRFGDAQLLRRLSDELHRRGMRLMLDVVLNHVAMDSPQVAERPHWFHNRGPLEDWNDPIQLVMNDVHGLPDLAVEREEVFRHLVDASVGWIERVRPDGFRLDAVKHLPTSFWARYNAEVRRRAGPDFVLLGELLDGDPALIARTWREGGFGAMFDFPLHFAMVDVFCRDQSPVRLGAALSGDRLYDVPGELVTLLDNHDLPRIASACGGDLERVRRALTFQLTARGTPSLTWGTESFLEGATEPENRGDMRFDSQPLREDIARLLRLRRDHVSLRDGAPLLLRADAGAFAYARIAPGEAALILVNQGASPARIQVPGELDGEAVDAFGAGPVRLDALNVAPRSVRVIFVQPREATGFAELARQARSQWTGGGPTRRVEFQVGGAPGARGDEVLVVGSASELGAWKPEAGLGPASPEGALVVELPVGSVAEYKLVVRRGGEIEWEPGANRTLVVVDGRAPLSLKHSWGSP